MSTTYHVAVTDETDDTRTTADLVRSAVQAERDYTVEQLRGRAATCGDASLRSALEQIAGELAADFQAERSNTRYAFYLDAYISRAGGIPPRKTPTTMPEFAAAALGVSDAAVSRQGPQTRKDFSISLDRMLTGKGWP